MRSSLAILCLLLGTARADGPHVTLDYSPMFDGFCARAAKQVIPPAAVEELSRRMDELRALWQPEEEPLFGAVVSLTGVPFRFHEARATLVLCDMPSMSLPLLFSVRHYLKVVDGDKTRAPHLFVDTVFHEVLHHYVWDALARYPDHTSPLLEKYKAEPPPVRAHLHLLALQSLVYDRLGRKGEIEKVLAAFRGLPAEAPVERAWAIVQKEGAAALVREISRR